jgi:hypothetical protein
MAMKREYFVQQWSDTHFNAHLWCIECDAHADEHMMLVHMNI